MELFHIIDDAVVIVRRNGVYRQCKLYRKGVDVFAQVGGGFVRLLAMGGTSQPAVSWDDFHVPDGSLRVLKSRHGAPLVSCDPLRIEVAA